MLFKRIEILLIVWAIVFTHTAFAIDTSTLSGEELSAAKKLGISEEDIKKFDEATFKQQLKEKLAAEQESVEQEARDKYNETIKNKVEPKLSEMQGMVEQEKEELKKDAVKLAAGYITSTISLFAATLIAPQVFMVCKTKPSAVIYVGTAAVYVLQEMTNIKVLKASQLAEIEVVNNISVDKTKTIKENSKLLEEKVDQQVGYIKAYKGTLDHTVEALKKKAKNAKMVSIGFLAASAAAVAEQMDWISGGGACIATASLDKINFSKSLDTKYAELINSATKTEDKWAYYYEWESLKFGTNRTLTASEYKNLSQVPVPASVLTNAINFIQASLLSSALAAEESKKVVVAEGLKDNKAADWIGDLDKLGIVGGLAINVVAYMAGWQLGFLKSIIASGTSRAVTFGVQGALAFTAGKLFQDAADDLEKKLQKIDTLINKIQNISKKGTSIIGMSDNDARHLKELTDRVGIKSDKTINEMSIDEASAYIKQMRDKYDSLDDAGKALLNRYETELSQKIKNKANEKTNEVEQKTEEKKEEVKAEVKTTTFIPRIMEFLFSSAAAAGPQAPTVVTKIRDSNCIEKKTCPDLIFPKSSNPNVQVLNQYLGLYERYYQGVKTDNSALANSSSLALEKNKNLIDAFRSAVFKKVQEKSKSTHTDYGEYERAGVRNEINKFTNFYNSLPPKDRLEMDGRLNPKSTQYAAAAALGNSPARTNKIAKTSGDERRILNLLISKLEAREPSVGGGPDMSFVERESQSKEDNYNFGNTSIHPKEAELFEIIHNRYQKFLKRTFPEL